jgi:hypothetical protein
MSDVNNTYRKGSSIKQNRPEATASGRFIGQATYQDALNPHNLGGYAGLGVLELRLDFLEVFEDLSAVFPYFIPRAFHRFIQLLYTALSTFFS